MRIGRWCAVSGSSLEETKARNDVLTSSDVFHYWKNEIKKEKNNERKKDKKK